jgi:hypothetical protein
MRVCKHLKEIIQKEGNFTSPLGAWGDLKLIE